MKQQPPDITFRFPNPFWQIIVRSLIGPGGRGIKLVKLETDRFITVLQSLLDLSSYAAAVHQKPSPCLKCINDHALQQAEQEQQWNEMMRRSWNIWKRGDDLSTPSIHPLHINFISVHDKCISGRIFTVIPSSSSSSTTWSSSRPVLVVSIDQ